MSVAQTQLAPDAVREFVATVDRIVSETVDVQSRVAGLLFAGLVLVAEGREEVNDSLGSTTPGP